MLLTECFRWERCIRAIAGGLAPGSSILQQLVSPVRGFSIPRNRLRRPARCKRVRDRLSARPLTSPIRTFSTECKRLRVAAGVRHIFPARMFSSRCKRLRECRRSFDPRRPTPPMMKAMSWIEGKSNVSKTDWFPGGQSSRRTPNRRSSRCAAGAFTAKGPPPRPDRTAPSSPGVNRGEAWRSQGQCHGPQ